MGALEERVKLNLLVYGNGIVENFKNNSLFFADKYSKSDDDVTAIDITNIQQGGFYFLHYMDDSNWLKFSPIFFVEQKKLGNKIILMAINLNFIPLEVRSIFFDPYITEEMFEKDIPLKVDYKKIYEELLKVGFEYTLMEFNAAQIKMVHKISMKMLPRFLYSQHPMAKYDPKKLMDIWTKKIETKGERNQEMMKSMMNEFYDINKDISEKYKVMKGHIERIQKSLKKYGGK
jgi:hypothetical protein